jgi:hypothetical protein
MRSGLDILDQRNCNATISISRTFKKLYANFIEIQKYQNHSVRKASKGSRRAAFIAGTTPATMPMSNETQKAITMYTQAISTGRSGRAVSRICTIDIPKNTPQIPPAALGASASHKNS